MKPFMEITIKIYPHNNHLVNIDLARGFRTKITSMCESALPQGWRYSISELRRDGQILDLYNNEYR